ncbi:MAG: HAD family hydrolase [Solobacterium sp.]|nr:HAD family hydrolase [Solobacterium sp.]
MKTALFWDFDGTLIYANESFYESFRDALAENGAAFPEEALYEFLHAHVSWHNPDRSFTERTGELWWQDLQDAMKEFCLARGMSADAARNTAMRFRQIVISPDIYRLYPDALSTLKTCHERGYDNYILSSNFPELPAVAEAFGLSPYIHGVMLSADIGWEKPRPELFMEAMKRAGTYDKCIMIGDNPAKDIAGGRAAGMKTIYVHPRPGTDNTECDAIVRELSEIPGVLK